MLGFKKFLFIREHERTNLIADVVGRLLLVNFQLSLKKSHLSYVLPFNLGNIYYLTQVVPKMYQRICRCVHCSVYCSSPRVHYVSKLKAIDTSEKDRALADLDKTRAELRELELRYWYPSPPPPPPPTTPTSVPSDKELRFMKRDWDW